MAACVAAAANEESSVIDELYGVHCQFRGFVAEKCFHEEKQCLVLSHRQLFNHPPLGLISRVRIVIEEDCQYVVQVVFRDFESGILVLESVKEEVSVLCRKYAPDSQLFKFCPGIDPDEYEKAIEVIRFNLKSVRKTTEPISRVDSVNCFLWWRLGATSSEAKREADAVLCRACSHLKCDLNHQMKRTSIESPSKKKMRQSASSKARLTYMSPTSQQQRKENQQREIKNMRKKLLHYERTELPLDDEQSNEMEAITTAIESNHRDELEKLFVEGRHF